MQFCSANQPYDGPQDKPHLPLEYIPQLRQFVQTAAAQEAAKTGQPIPVGQQVALCIRGIGHGAELDEGERLTVQTGPLLAEEDG